MYLFAYTGVQNDFHIGSYSCGLSVARQVSLVEQELLATARTPKVTPVFSLFHVAQSSILCYVFDEPYPFSFGY